MGFGFQGLEFSTQIPDGSEGLDVRAEADLAHDLRITQLNLYVYLSICMSNYL